MRRISIYQYGLALALATIALNGCGWVDDFDNSNNSPAIQSVESYPVSGVLKETDGMAMPGTVTLAATDSNGNAVKLYSDQTGGKEITSVTTADDGMVSFYVDSAATMPVTIMAAGSSSVPNHLASSSKFTVDKAGTTYFKINIIDMDVPSAGVLPHIENGVLGDADDFLVTPFAMQVTSTQVTIPANTAFQDSAGNNLVGTVKASLTAFASSTTTTPIIDPAVFDTTVYDPEDELGQAAILKESDLENFPGGLNNSHAPAGNGYFVTAGFVAVNMTDAGGRVAKKVANAGTFSIRMNIPAGTLNPHTDALLTAGDFIPVFTYDETTMVWKPEVDASNNQILRQVELDPLTGGLYVLHTTNHFSFWNLGWLVTGAGKSCTATLNLQNDAIAFPLNLKATFTSSGDKKGKNLLLTGFKPAGDATVTATNVPNRNLDIVLTDAFHKVVWSKKNVNWCSAPLTASYIAPVSKKAIPVTVKVTEYCTQDPTQTQVVPSTLTTVTKAVNNSGRFPPVAYIPISFGFTDSTGTFIHKLVAGTYNFSAFDRRTATFVPATAPINPVTIVKNTQPTVLIKIPVACKPPITGSTGGYTF